jgi:hypothetical protein
MYGFNLERRIMDKILYEIDSSDIPRYHINPHLLCLKEHHMVKQGCCTSQRMVVY